MKPTVRGSLAGLHTWSGLLAGWLLFAVFLTGTASYYRSEITQWMRPELRLASVSAAGAARIAFDRLGHVAANAWQWNIDFPTARDPAITIFYRGNGRDKSAFGREKLDPSTGKPIVARKSYGGDSLYYFHFDLLMPSIWGRLIVGFCAVMMLVGIVTGIVTHRRIFRDFFTFRPGRSQRTWLDAHNICGVMALPYHLAITYTGIVTLLLLYTPWGVDISYKGDTQAFLKELRAVPRLPAPSGRPAALLGGDAIVGAVRSRWNNGAPGRMTITYPGDANARVTVYRADTETVAYRGQWLVLDGRTGAVLQSEQGRGAAIRTRNLSYGLHLGRFAAPFLRGLLFFSGVAGTAMVATGLLLWTIKRRRRLSDPRHPPFGFRLVEKLNIGFIAGLPAGIAGHFLSNRLLPLTAPARADWEVASLFAVWGAVAIWGAIRPRHRAWPEGLGICAFLFCVIPLVNTATTDRGLLPSLFQGDWVFAGFDIAALVIGTAFAGAAIFPGSLSSDAGKEL